ncbi:MAG: glycerophosphodiester phosphodiesterase [Patescibacteria group bacterium]|nr:glycerophosphodiester phosphodiesterase [Patescibacteria group bacterium]
MEKILIVAHRGASVKERGNTIKAFALALELGADMIELDVRQTRDGKLAVIHDSGIDGQNISQLTLAELNNIAKAKGFEVPELVQVLRFIKDQIPAQIELKETGYETKVANQILQILQPEEFYVISFNLSSLKNIKQNFPQIRTGLILGSGKRRIWTSRWHLLRLKRILPYFNMVAMSEGLWRHGWAQKFPADLPVCVWTVDDEPTIKKILSDPRVAYLTSNNPDLAIKLRGIHAA